MSENQLVSHALDVVMINPSSGGGGVWKKNKSTELPLAADILSSDVVGGGVGGEASQTSHDGVGWWKGAGARRRCRGTSVRAVAGWARVRPVRIPSSSGDGGGGGRTDGKGVGAGR